MNRAGAAERILLVRTSALGDVVHALPVLAALRRARPAARLAWVVDETFAPVLERHGLLDELLPVPLRRWRRPGAERPRELAAFLGRLRGFGADLALDLMGNHKGALLARLSGARLRLGWRRADRREPASAVWLNRRVPAGGGHAVERGLALLAALGIPPAPADFAPAALALGREQRVDHGGIFLHPGAAWPNKRYPPEQWGRAAAAIRDRLALPVLVGAGPGEEALAERVVAASDGAARRFDAPDLGTLAGVVRGARLVLAGDTGALHLARALGVPVLGLYGPTDPARHGPYGAPESVLVRHLPCSFCHRRLDETKACLAGISPLAVAERAARLAVV